jgi:hypothetical protein
MQISPKNWREFQHYKNRRPPWVRLHRSLLDDFDFCQLPIASKALVPMLWLLASEGMDGVIDATPAKLAFRLRCSVDEIDAGLNPLIDSGFFVVASDVLATCTQPACSEADTDSEADTETDGAKAPEVFPAGLDTAAWMRWIDYRKKFRKPLKPVSIPAAQRELSAFGSDQGAVVEQSIAQGWQGLFALKGLSKSMARQNENISASLKWLEKTDVTQ